MPTLREIQERTTQQVRSFASHSIDYVQAKISALNGFIVGKNRPARNSNWSTTTSERNLRGSESSKKNKQALISVSLSLPLASNAILTSKICNK